MGGNLGTGKKYVEDGKRKDHHDNFDAVIMMVLYFPEVVTWIRGVDGVRQSRMGSAYDGVLAVSLSGITN
jgi:hypothetical protein